MIRVRKILVSTAVVCMLLVSLIPASVLAASTTLTAADVTIVGNEIRAYNSAYTDIIIPDVIDGVTILSIDSYVFNNKGLTKVELPSTLQTIGSNAFSENNLTEITLPAGLQVIGHSAFYENGITSLDIPNSVNTLNQNTFCNNEIETLTIGSGLLTIPRSCFSNNKISSLTIPNNVTTIEYGAFSSNEMTTLNFASGSILATIGDDSFRSNSITALTLPDSVRTVGVSAFSGNAIATLDLGTGVETIDDWAFAGNALTAPLTIPNSVTIIGSHSFLGGDQYVDNNNNITGLVLGNSVESIGEDAFKGNSITNVDIPDTCSYVGEGAFQENAITTLTIGSSLTTIERDTFRSNQIASVTIPDTVATLGNLAFYENSITTLSIGSGVSAIPTACFQYNLLETLVIPDTVLTIGSSAFNNNRLLNVTIGSGVTSIGDRAFVGSEDETPGNNIGVLALGSGLEEIGTYAFAFNNISSLIVPDNVVTISDNAFEENGMDTLALGTSLVTVGPQAFYNNNLESIALPSTCQTIEARAFEYNDLATVTLNNGLITLGYAAFAHNSLTSVDLGTTIEYIENYAFEVNNLSDITFPDSVTFIGAGYACENNLGDVILPPNLTEMSDQIFRAMGLDSVTFKNEWVTDLADFNDKYYQLYRIGYTFDGWYEDAAFTTPISDSTFAGTGYNTIYAKWVEGYYTITYDGGVQETHEIGADGYYNDGSAIVPPAPELRLVGWTDEAEGEGRIDYNLGAKIHESEKRDYDYTLYGVWHTEADSTYTTEHYFQNIDGTYPAACGDSDVLEGAAGYEVLAKEKEYLGFTFDKFYNTDEQRGLVADDNSLVLKLYYTRNSYDVVFDKNGGDAGAMANQSILNGDTQPLNANGYSKTNYTFDHWNTAADDSGTSYADAADFTMGTADVTLYAIYTPDPAVVNYDANSGTGTIDAVNGYHDDQIELADGTALSREGFVLDGYSEDAAALTADYLPSAYYSMKSGSTTLYAVWMRDTDNDGVSDADETAAGTDPADPNDTPENDVKVKGVVKDSAGNPVAGATVILNSEPVETTTDANGEFTFTGVQSAPHTITIRTADGNLGRYELMFTSGTSDSANVTNDGSSSTTSGRAIVTVSDNFELLSLNFTQNASGYYVLGAAANTRSASSTTYVATNPSTGDSSSNWWIWLTGLCALTALGYALKRLYPKFVR